MRRRPAPPRRTPAPLHQRYRHQLLLGCGVITAIALGAAFLVQPPAQAQEHGAQPTPVVETPATSAPASDAAIPPTAATPLNAAAGSTPSNVPPPQGQVGPQAMVTAQPHQASAAADGAISADPLVRGAYLARMGDCVACHSVPGGQPFAGGLPMATPIGTIYSSNITPDKDTGIGNYRFEDFDQAVRHGVAKGKGSLYPAMPFPSYARVSEQDMKDLYAYFMQKVEPVAVNPPANGIPWPLSMRWPLGIWQTLFAPDATKVQATDDAAPPNADPKLRGAYLVQGLGHCGACHTPRSVTMAEKALDDRDPLFLSGSNQPMDGWVAKSLRGGDADGLGRWTTQDIVDLLRTGRNNHSAVFGGMGDVIRHSTQYLSTDDLQAIAVYLKSLPAAPSSTSAAAFNPNSRTADALWKGDTAAMGAGLYLDNCAACHRTDGKGYAQVFPSLAGNSAVLTADPHNLVAIILQGHQVPATDTRPSSFTMPAFGWRLNDQQVAEVASFVRGSWGNQASAVSASQVQKLRPPAANSPDRSSTRPSTTSPSPSQ